MFRRRLRPAWDKEVLHDIYPQPHDHRIYGAGHDIRVQATIEMGRWLTRQVTIKSVADLSCGNAAIPRAINADAYYLGDYAKGYEFTGPIEETITKVPEVVDLFICSETIEHLDDPEAVLRAIGFTSRHLLLSTPIGEDDLGNIEHYWGWDQEAVGAMLADTGWGTTIGRVDVILPNTYSYQIWGVTHG